MTKRLIHGFNVKDFGEGTVNRLAPHLSGEVRKHTYGYVNLFRVASNNKAKIKYLATQLNPGDVLICHSNACLIAWELSHIYSQLGAVVCIQPALRRDALWPEDLPVLCLYNKYDNVVQWGRMWGRLNSVGNKFHGWGAAGKYGFDQGKRGSGFTNVNLWNTANDQIWAYPVRGHSELFQTPQYWGQEIDFWAEAKKRRFT